MATRRQKSGKVFYGWWIVLVAGIGLSVHHAPIIGFTFGVFLKSLSQEFSWSRTQISLAFTLGTLGITLAAPFLGRLVDRFGARRVILPAALLFGLGVLSLYFLSAHLWHFYAISLFMGVVGSGTGPVPYSKVISRWFDQQRGLALGLTLVGSRGDICHALAGASAYHQRGLALYLRAPRPADSGDYAPSGWTVSHRDAAEDGTVA